MGNNGRQRARKDSRDNKNTNNNINNTPVMPSEEFQNTSKGSTQASHQKSVRGINYGSPLNGLREERAERERVREGA